MASNRRAITGKYGVDSEREEKYRYHPSQRIPTISLHVPDDRPTATPYEIIGCDWSDDGLPIYQLIPALAVGETINDDSENRHVEIINLSAEMLDHYVSPRQIEAFEHRDPENQWSAIDQDASSAVSARSMTSSTGSRRRSRPDYVTEALQQPPAKRPQGRPPKKQPAAPTPRSIPDPIADQPFVALGTAPGLISRPDVSVLRDPTGSPRGKSASKSVNAKRKILVPTIAVANSSRASSETESSTAEGLLSSLRHSAVLPCRVRSSRQSSRERSSDRIVKRRGRPPAKKPVLSSTTSESSSGAPTLAPFQHLRTPINTPAAHPIKPPSSTVNSRNATVVASPRRTQQPTMSPYQAKQQTTLSRFFTASSTSSEDVIAPSRPLIPPSSAKTPKGQGTNAALSVKSPAPVASDLQAAMADATIDEEDYEISHIVSDMLVDGQRMYEVAWVGYPLNETTYLTRAGLSDAKDLLKAYIKAKKRVQPT